VVVVKIRVLHNNRRHPFTTLLRCVFEWSSRSETEQAGKDYGNRKNNESTSKLYIHIEQYILWKTVQKSIKLLSPITKQNM
jgi:hypothetical protein